MEWSKVDGQGSQSSNTVSLDATDHADKWRKLGLNMGLSSMTQVVTSQQSSLAGKSIGEGVREIFMHPEGG